MPNVIDPVFDGLAWILAWFYSLIPDFTFAICMLTLAIMLVFTPLTLRGARAMTKTQALQPEMTRLRKQYAGDRQKINEETMKLYGAHGVSPLGGCLPNLVQLPIFFVLYRVILNLRITPDDPLPRNLSSDVDLYSDLVDAVGSDGFGQMRSLSMDLAKSVWEVLTDASDVAGFLEGFPYLGLVAVTFILAWLQQRQMAKRRAGGPAGLNRQMELMMKYMPFMLPVFSFIVPAALVPYFIVSSLYRMLTQAFIHATMKPPQPLTNGVIEAETVDEPVDQPKATPKGQVSNQRSRKALDAESARQAAREQRSAERRDGSKSLPGHAPDNRVADGSNDDPPETRRTRSSSERVADADKRARKGSASADGDAKKKRGRRRGRSAANEGPRPIQSRRTSGDGRTRNRRKR